MRIIPRLLCLLLAFLLVLPMSGCGKEDAAYSVGICQMIEFSAHDDATKGFTDALNALLPGQVKITTKNAANEIGTCSTIINQFLAENVDLILANATPALQVASAATADVPVLGTSITEYGAIMGLDVQNGIVGGNVSGTSDLAPLDQQAAMVKEWFPNAKTVGLLYCSAEVNSEFQITGMDEELQKLGYECVRYAFTDSNDLAAMVETASDHCDVIYVPTDNTLAANAPIIDNICRYKKVPVIGGDAGICAACSVAALRVSYYDLGYATGEMAAKILTGEADIAAMPIQYAPCDKVANTELCSELGLSVPEGYASVSEQK